MFKRVRCGGPAGRRDRATISAAPSTVHTVDEPRSQWPFERGAVITVGLGRVVLQLLALRAAESHDLTRVTLPQAHGPWRESLVELWPKREPSISWPPAKSFSDHGVTLDMLSERFLVR